MDEFLVPVGGALERILVGHIVDEQGTLRPLIVVFGECMVLFLTGRVPND